MKIKSIIQHLNKSKKVCLSLHFFFSANDKILLLSVSKKLDGKL